jgi:hypothetical protein
MLRKTALLRLANGWSLKCLFWRRRKVKALSSPGLIVGGQAGRGEETLQIGCTTGGSDYGLLTLALGSGAELVASNEA